MQTGTGKIKRVLLAGNEREDVRRGVCQYAQKAGWVVILSGPPDGEPGEVAEFWSAAGLIVQSCGDPARWARSRVPVVGLGWQFQTGVTVTWDARAAGQLAAEHLLEQRFVHLAYCHGGYDLWGDRQREGFAQAARRGGAEFHQLDWSQSRAARRGFTSKALRQWLAQELAALPKPVGVLLETDWMAVDALQACMEAGLPVPEQVALIGVGDWPEICEATPVPLSSVRIDGHRQGYRAAELLDAMISGQRVARQHVLIPPRGVAARDSSNIIAIPHLPTARALRYIWEHLGDSSLTPKVVAATAGLSRRSMDLYFREHLGSTVAGEISNARLTRAMGLLAATNNPVTRIARDTGFSNSLHLRRTFARAHGRPLHQWRKETRARGAQQQPDPGPSESN